MWVTVAKPCLRCPVGPAFDCGFGDFNGVPALAADQVVVFLAAAPPRSRSVSARTASATLSGALPVRQ